MSDTERSAGPPSEMVRRVTNAFLIFSGDKLFEHLRQFATSEHTWAPLVHEAEEGLRSVLSAASLPFLLTYDAVQQRQFDRLLSAERIRSLKDVTVGEGLSHELEKRSHDRASANMEAFVATPDGSDYLRDGIVHELDRALRSRAVSAAATELLVQALVSSWAVFENFARSFIISWVNADAARAKPLLASPAMKEYFGKPVVSIDVIGDHGYDLTNSMGSVLFKGKRLDSLSVIRALLDALFNRQKLRDALGRDLWMLNQRRHLFVHRRGMVDDEYLERTGDKAPLGQRLSVTSDDLEQCLLAVQNAIVAIAITADEELGFVVAPSPR